MKKIMVVMGIFLGLSLRVLAVGELPDFTGRIAIIGSDYNIYTISPTAVTPLTTDGSESHAYQWPTWSRDGRLAYFCCDLASANSFETGVYISADGLTSGREVISSFGQSVIYASWSPANCENDTSCRDLAILVSDPTESSLRVQLIRDRGTDRTVSDAGFGSPFYTAFSPDGSALLFHRNNSAVEVFTIEDGNTAKVIEGDSSGTFQAAMWSPVDNRLLYGVSGSAARTDLAISENGTSRVLVQDVPGLVAFEWSPNGEYIAYRSRTRETLGNVIVVDSMTGETVAQSGGEAFSFWWSPDSSSIAMMQVGADTGNSAAIQRTIANRAVAQTDNPALQWSVLTIASGQSRIYTPFFPNYELVYLANYFDQFYISHQIWSPDSRYLVYSELIAPSGNSQVTLLDTQEGGTYKLADGFIGVWSYE